MKQRGAETLQIFLMRIRDKENCSADRSQFLLERERSAESDFNVSVYYAKNQIRDELQNVGKGEEKGGLSGYKVEEVETELLLERNQHFQSEDDRSEDDGIDVKVRQHEVPDFKLKRVFVHFVVGHFRFHFVELARGKKKAKVQIIQCVGRRTFF